MANPLNGPGSSQVAAAASESKPSITPVGDGPSPAASTPMVASSGAVSSGTVATTTAVTNAGALSSSGGLAGLGGIATTSALSAATGAALGMPGADAEADDDSGEGEGEGEGAMATGGGAMAIATPEHAPAPAMPAAADGGPDVAPAAATSAPALPKARPLVGDHHIARLLRLGAITAGGCFAASLCVELLPSSATTAYAIDLLRKAGMLLLIATPVARIIAAGVMLGLKGEWRYALFTGCILLLLALALGAGFTA